jgi:endonuclease/exonuclease/phosphatase family metal-dependent hydrolase
MTKSTALPIPALVLVLTSSVVAGCGTSSDELVAPATVDCADQEEAPAVVRIASYNIQATKSSSIEEVGDVIEHLDADVLALQEIHKNIPWTGDIDQAQVLADRFGYQLVYAASLEKSGGSQGVALLSRFPFHEVERVDLDAPLQNEPRVAINASLCAGPTPIHVVSTHNDVLPWSGESQAKALLEHVKKDMGEGLIVAGDFNALPDWGGPLAFIAAGLTDVLDGERELSSFIGDLFPRRLDYLFADEPLAKQVVRTGMLDEVASDHLPVFADVDVRGADEIIAAAD